MSKLKTDNFKSQNKTHLDDEFCFGMNFIYEMDIDEEIEPTSLENDMQLLVSKEFVKNNANNQMSFEKMNVKLVVKNKEE